MNETVVIPISPEGGPVSVSISAPQFPQNFTGIVWRYNSSSSAGESAGQFFTKASEVPLGAPSVVKDKLFLVEGGILNKKDNPPTPYRIVISVTQGGKVLHTEVPADNGSGKIGKEDIPFLYRFQLKTA